MLQQHQIVRHSSSLIPLNQDDECLIHQDYRIEDRESVQSSNSLINRHPIQAKMLLGNSQERYEQEADEASQMVLNCVEERGHSSVDDMRMKSHSDVTASQVSFRQPRTPHPLITPSAQHELSTERTLQIHQVITGTGRSLAAPLRQQMEYGFGGEDFSHVQMHTTPNAIAAAQSIGAKAFTVGHHIVGDVNHPKVLAHELQHVRQQSHQTSNPNIQTVQCMLTGTLSELRTEAGEPSRKAKAKGFITFGLAKSTYTQIMEAIFQYESMEGEVESGFDPPPIGTCLRMLEEITSLIDQWFTTNQQDQEGLLRRSDLTRGETLSRVRHLVSLEYDTVHSLGHPDVLRLRQDRSNPRHENEARSRSITTQNLEDIQPPRYSQLLPERYSRLFPDGPPSNFWGEGNLDTIPEEENNSQPLPPRPVRPRTTSSAGVRLRLGTALSTAPWIPPRPEPSSPPPPPRPPRLRSNLPSTPPPPVPERPWQNTASNIVSNSSNASPPTPPPRGVSRRAQPLPPSFFSRQSREDRTRMNTSSPSVTQSNAELSVAPPPSYNDVVGVGRQELRPDLWHQLMPSWTKATAIDDAIAQMLGSANIQGGLTQLHEPLTQYSQGILSNLKKAYVDITIERRKTHLRRAYDYVATLRHYVEQANDLYRIDRSTYQQITMDLTQLSQMLHQFCQTRR